MEKAFDCVNHKILLTKLEFCGITGNHYKLYKSYLMDRYQRTMLYIENSHITTPTWFKVERGVPQGSVLGTLLFLVFINGSSKFINDKSVLILFADGTSILVSHPHPQTFYKNSNAIIQTLNAWFKHNLLSNLTQSANQHMHTFNFLFIKTYLKFLKTLLHVSVIQPSSGSL